MGLDSAHELQRLRASGARKAVQVLQVEERQDVVFGATVSGRSAPVPGIEQMVGVFNTAVEGLHEKLAGKRD